MFRPNFIPEHDRDLPDRLRASCLELGRLAKEQGVDATPVWDEIIAQAREHAKHLESMGVPAIARDYLGMHLDIIAECRAVAT
jgi:hypothetical protein